MSALETARELAERLFALDRDLGGLSPEEPEFRRRWEADGEPLLERFCHPEIEFRSHLIGTEGGRPYLGVEGVRAYLRDVYENLSRFERELVDLEEVRDGVVIVHQRVTTEGKASGAPAETQVWAVWRFEDGRLRTSDTYLEREKALAAASPDSPVRP